MEGILFGAAIALNFILLKIKYNMHRYEDLFMDGAVLVVLSFLFGGTMGGMTAAMFGGAIISLYLLFTHKESHGPN
jgi:hypothetical protein